VNGLYEYQHLKVHESRSRELVEERQRHKLARESRGARRAFSMPGRKLVQALGLSFKRQQSPDETVYEPVTCEVPYCPRRVSEG
jgi:hypothetical protein